MKKIVILLTSFLILGCYGQVLDNESKIAKVKPSLHNDYLFDYKLERYGSNNVWFYSNDTFYVGQKVNLKPIIYIKDTIN